MTTRETPNIGREVNPAAVRFVRACRVLRQENGYSPEDLAAEIGLSPTGIRKVERSNGHLRLGTALRLLEFWHNAEGMTMEAMTTPDPEGKW